MKLDYVGKLERVVCVRYNKFGLLSGTAAGFREEGERNTY